MSRYERMKSSLVISICRIEQERAMSVSETFRGVGDESVESMTLDPGSSEFHREPRCRICRNDQVRTSVNDLLATGASYAQIVRALGDDNAALDKCDGVTIDSICNHATRHYPFSRSRAPPTVRSSNAGRGSGDRLL
jgi:hypothetical protein